MTSTTRDYQTFTTKSTSKEQRRKMDVGDIYSNAAKCLKCGDVIRSRNVHDYVICSCGNLSVDGGSWYAKRACRDGWDTIEDMIEGYDDV